VFKGKKIAEAALGIVQYSIYGIDQLKKAFLEFYKSDLKNCSILF